MHEGRDRLFENGWGFKVTNICFSYFYPVARDLYCAKAAIKRPHLFVFLLFLEPNLISRAFLKRQSTVGLRRQGAWESEARAEATWEHLRVRVAEGGRLSSPGIAEQKR